ncbi:tRNA guanosine(34) transglycosylase Tgt [bacterium]|nr:tRNA guanosine(34) transglycosylase Tgt [Chloroflexi bacterium CFX6]RIL11333.1 MAG: tRNA guanosine(34) transglycosylase Tgt [bacterium]
MGGLRFDVVARDGASLARRGVLYTPHGPIATPAFAPVGTQGAVKALAPRDLLGLGVEVVMANAYHLAMRPGADTVAALGGLHALSGWDGPLMTDSGGFQIFSLQGASRVDDDGVTFKSHVDGSMHRFTPESVVALQQTLGADLVMPLDVCTGHPAPRARAAHDMRVTLRWAERARRSHTRPDQWLYGIVQGSVYADLRAESARSTAQLGFPAYAIGGVSVGESKPEMLAAVEAAVPHLPPHAPRHLLGVGHPEDIVEGVARGIDTFDCVMPTRVARTAAALTMDGRINLRNASHVADLRPLDPACGCYACQRFSRGAIRHLFMAGEMLGPHLLTLHNVHFTLDLLRRIRAALESGTFGGFRRDFLARYAHGAYAPARIATATAG